MVQYSSISVLIAMTAIYIIQGSEPVLIPFNLGYDDLPPGFDDDEGLEQTDDKFAGLIGDTSKNCNYNTVQYKKLGKKRTAKVFRGCNPVGELLNQGINLDEASEELKQSFADKPGVGINNAKTHICYIGTLSGGPNTFSADEFEYCQPSNFNDETYWKTLAFPDGATEVVSVEQPGTTYQLAPAGTMCQGAWNYNKGDGFVPRAAISPCMPFGGETMPAVELHSDQVKMLENQTGVTWCFTGDDEPKVPKGYNPNGVGDKEAKSYMSWGFCTLGTSTAEPTPETITTPEPTLETITTPEPTPETITTQEPTPETITTQEPTPETVTTQEPTPETITTQEPTTEPPVGQEDKPDLGDGSVGSYIIPGTVLALTTLIFNFL